MTTRAGNGVRRCDDNHPVHAIAELMDVVQDLCRYAAAFSVVGRPASAETLIEQCGDLLAHRARLLDRSGDDARALRRPTDASAPAPRRGIRWTN